MKRDTVFNYLPVNEQSIRTGFYLTGAGFEQIAAHQPYPTPEHPEMYNFSWHLGRVLPEYQFVLIFSGEGEFESHATGPVRVTQGMGFFLLPDVWHRYRPTATVGWADYWLSFNGNLPHLWQQAEILAPHRVVQRIARPKAVLKAVSKLHATVVNSPNCQPAASLTALGILAGLLAEAQPIGEQGIAKAAPPDAAADTLLARAIYLIWNHSHRTLTAALIAEQLGVTRRTLERHFKSSHHRTVAEEIIACRVSRAQLMLASTHLPIKNVALASGFRSSSHLSTTFQRELKQTPGQFRSASKSLFKEPLRQDADRVKN